MFAVTSPEKGCSAMITPSDWMPYEKIENDIGKLYGYVMRIIDIKPEEAEALLEQLRQLSRELKGQLMLPKRPLQALQHLIGALKGNAAGMGPKEAIALRYAKDFERVFGLIIDDKSDLDLPPPGVPRVF
jgi:hypothetical protein